MSTITKDRALISLPIDGTRLKREHGSFRQRLAFWILQHRLGFVLKPTRIKFHADSVPLGTAQRIELKPQTLVNARSLKVGLVKDGEWPPDFTKFKRFLETNCIPWQYYDIHSSSWLEDARKFNVITWVPTSFPWELDEAREKIFFLERSLHKLVYPSVDEAMFFENKLLQYYKLQEKGFPVIDTFISHDYDEVMDWLEKADFPLVSKSRITSSSLGVTLLESKKQARRFTERVFRTGMRTAWPSIRQKNYVLFQKYVRNPGFDVRVIVIDEDHIFGYFREVPRDDFRASGRGDVVKNNLPKDAIKTALAITKELGFTSLAVDFLQSLDDAKFYVIEASTFIQVETDMQLMVNGIPGRYLYDPATDALSFEEGRFWIQELSLRRWFEMHDDLLRTIASVPSR